MTSPRIAAVLIAASLALAAPAQDGPPPPVANPPALNPPSPQPTQDRPLGWLSDPNEPPETALDALVSGKISLDNNLRIELADTTNRDSSTAITNRLRLGYATKPFHGFSAFIEMENVATPDAGNYFVPQTGDGSPSRTPVADPPGTEVNQAFGRFKTNSIGDSGITLDIQAGRQRIVLDDARFIGNVGWRQFEQTYDAASLRTNAGVDTVTVFYAYVWGVQRIFGPDGPNPDSDAHLLHIAYNAAPELTITPFVYLLDFGNDDPANSSDTLGIRLTGDLWRDAEADADTYADYELTYAHQSDAGANPTEYDADFLAAQFRVTREGLGHLVAGYQFLGSDDGRFAFRFPLGTNHKFQGFADNFLVTPNAGLQDLYIGVGTDLLWGVRGSITYHEFWTDQGGDDLGEEIDLVATKQITPTWSILVKAAFYDGDNGQPDTTRFWAQTTFKF